MVMLADIDDPPPPRWRGILIGAVLALPVVYLVGQFVLPVLHGTLTGEAEKFDDRLRQEDAYMKGVCLEALSLPRDESLCKCALATEFPSLDCRANFLEWSLQRQQEQCSGREDKKSSVAFCACVAALSTEIEDLESAQEKRAVAQRYAGCTELDEALYLPTLEQLQTDS